MASGRQASSYLTFGIVEQAGARRVIEEVVEHLEVAAEEAVAEDDGEEDEPVGGGEDPGLGGEAFGGSGWGRGRRLAAATTKKNQLHHCHPRGRTEHVWLQSPPVQVRDHGLDQNHAAPWCHGPSPGLHLLLASLGQGDRPRRRARGLGNLRRGATQR